MLSRLASLAGTRSPAATLAWQSLLHGAINIRTLSVVVASRTGVSCAGSVHRPLAIPPQQQHPNHNRQQIRTKTGRGWTYTKQRQKRMARAKKRAEMRERGIPLPKPPNYMPRDLPVINARSDAERKAEIKAHDARVTEELHAKLQAAQAKPLLRFHMTGLRMSDRVRKLFDLHNGNQQEVVKAQKQRGMEVFQLRPGDTGSSAVQVIALTTRIQQMQTHMAKHRKDKHNQRNMQRMLTRRRKVLDYMERKEFDDYRRVVKTLGLVRS